MTPAALALLPLVALAAGAPGPAPKGEPSASPTQQAPPRQPDGAAPAPGAQKPAAPADTAKTLYAVGLAVANSLEIFSLSPSELDTVLRGIRDGVADKPRFPLDADMQAAVNELARARAPKAAEKAAAREKEQGPPYLARMAKEKGAKKLPSGVIVVPLSEGTGPSPAATDKVKVHYTGTLVSGRVFESSVHRAPVELPLDKVIPCWTQGFQALKVGAKAKIVCPPEQAYGASGTGAIPGNAVLTFEVELLEIVK